MSERDSASTAADQEMNGSSALRGRQGSQKKDIQGASSFGPTGKGGRDEKVQGGAPTIHGNRAASLDRELAMNT